MAANRLVNTDAQGRPPAVPALSLSPVSFDVRDQMTPQQLIGIGVRLFALWLFARSIPYFGAIPTQLAATPIAGTEGASALPTA
jgi:hypothetical protein